jgi:hypothetical protein
LTAAEKASTATGVSTGLGATMGAGVVKGTIYGSVKDALMEAGQDEATAEAKAQEAQAYGGENWGSILAGTVLGGVAGRTGVEKMILGKFAAKEGAEQALLPAAGRGAVTEAVPEAVQAGQEKMAENIALQKFADETGEEVPLFRGVAGQAALEGLVGGALGAGVGATTRTRPAPVTPTGEPTEPQITEEQRAAAEQVDLGDALAQARAGVTDVGTDEDADYQAYMAGQTATPATPTAPVTEKPKRGKKAKVELSAEEQKAVDAYNTPEVAAQAAAQKAAIDEQLSLDQEAEAEARQDAREERARYGAGETAQTLMAEPTPAEVTQPAIEATPKVEVTQPVVQPSVAVTAKEESLADKKERLKQARAAKNKVAKGQLDIGETYAQTDEGVALDNEIAQLEDETRMIETYERTRQTLGKSEKNKPWEDLSADEKMVYEDALGANIVYGVDEAPDAREEFETKTEEELAREPARRRAAKSEKLKEGISEGLEDIVLGAIGELTAYRKSKGEGKGKKNTAIAAYEINRKAESNYRGINLPRWNLLPEPAKKAFLDKVFSPEESSSGYAGPTYEVQQAGFDAVQELVKEEFAAERPELEEAARLKESEAAAQRRVRAEEETEELSLKQKLPEDIVQIIKEPVKGGDTGQKTEKVLEYLRKNAKGVYKGKVKGLLFDYSGLTDKVTSKMNRLVAGSLSGLGLKTKIQYVDTNDFIAYYDAKTDTVYVGNRGLNETAVLHELVHAATVKVIFEVKNETEKDPRKIEAVKRLEELMDFSKRKLWSYLDKSLSRKERVDRGMPYNRFNRAFLNIYEFVAYAMTDPKFQAELQKLTAPGHLIKYSDIRNEPTLTAEEATGLPIKGTFAEKKSEQAEPVSYSALGDNPNNLYAAFVETVADIIGLFRRAATAIKSIGVPAQFFDQGRTKSAKEVEEDLELSEDDKAEIAEEMGERARNIRKEGRVYNPLIKKADDLNGRYTKHLADQRLAEERLVKEAQAEFGDKGPKAKDFDALRKLVNTKPEMIRFRQEGNKLRTEIEQLNKELRDADLEDFEIEETVGDKKYGVMYSVTPGALGNLFLEVAGAFDTIIAAPPEGGIPSFTVAPDKESGILRVGAPQQTPEQQAQAEKERLINKTENDQTSSFKRFGGVMRNIFTKQGYNDLVRKVQNRTREFVLLERNLTRLGIANWVGDKINVINTTFNDAIGRATNKHTEFKEFERNALDALRNLMRLQGKKYSEVLADLQMYMTGLHDHERRMELFYRTVPLIDSANTQRELIYRELGSDALGKLYDKNKKAAERRTKELKNKLILLATDRSNFKSGLSAEQFDPNSDEYNPLSYPAAVAAIFRDTYKDASSEVKAELEKLFGTDTEPGLFKQILDKAKEVNAESNYFTAPVQNYINFYGYKHYFPFKGRGGDTDKQDKLNFTDPFMSERLGNDHKEGQTTFMGRQTAADNPVLQIFTEATKSSMRFGFKNVPIAMKNLIEQKIVAGSEKPLNISFQERSVPGFKFADAGVKQDAFFVYKDDGSIDVYEINDPNMRRAFKGIYEESSPITDLLNKVTSTIGAMHTRYNPAFAPLDFTRNLMTYAGLLGSKYGPKAAGQMYAAMAGVIADGGIHKTFKFSRLFSAGNTKEMEALAKSDPYYADVREYYGRGGQVAYMDGLTNSQALAAVASKLSANKKFNLENFQDFTDAYMAMFEITSRVAAFRILKRRFIEEEKMDPESAAERAKSEAKDLANFQQVGEIGRGLGAFFMFWRPAATGAVKAIDEVIIPALDNRSAKELTEYYKTRPGATDAGVQKAVREHLEQRKNARYMAAILFGVGMFTYLMAYSLAGEDDEGRNKVLTDDPSRWVRFARINLGVQENGRDLVFQIPWGFGPGALASAGAQVMATLFGAQDPMRMGINLVQAGSESFVPLPVSKIDPVLDPTKFIVDSAMPSALRPLLQFSMNTDGLGRKIYSDRQSRFADAYLGGDNVPEVYKDAARRLFELTSGGIDISPGTAYFFANNYIDGVSRLAATGYNLTDVIKGEKEFDIRTDSFLLDSYFKAPSNYDAIQFSRAEAKIKEMEKRLKSLEGTDKYMTYVENNPMAPATVKYYNKVINGQLRNLRQRANEVREADLTQKEKTELLQLLTKQQNQIKMAFVNAIDGLETAYTGYEE